MTAALAPRPASRLDETIEDYLAQISLSLRASSVYSARACCVASPPSWPSTTPRQRGWGHPISTMVRLMTCAWLARTCAGRMPRLALTMTTRKDDARTAQAFQVRVGRMLAGTTANVVRMRVA